VRPAVLELLFEEIDAPVDLGVAEPGTARRGRLGRLGGGREQHAA
jgi:hypothetical protein